MCIVYSGGVEKTNKNKTYFVGLASSSVLLDLGFAVMVTFVIKTTYFVYIPRYCSATGGVQKANSYNDSPKRGLVEGKIVRGFCKFRLVNYGSIYIFRK